MGYSDTINNVYGVFDRRRAEERQAMLDALHRQQVESNLKTAESNRELNELYKKAQVENMESMAQQRLRSGLSMGQQLDPSTAGKLDPTEVIPGKEARQPDVYPGPQPEGIAPGVNDPGQEAVSPKYAGSRDEQTRARREKEVDTLLATDPNYGKLDPVRRHLLRNILITGSGSTAGIYPDDAAEQGKAYEYDEESRTMKELGPIEGGKSHFFTRNRFNPNS